MRGQVNRCAQPLPQIRFQKFICRISLIAGSPIIEGTERSGWQLDLTTALEDFQITNVHPTDGYGFADLMDGRFSTVANGRCFGLDSKWHSCGTGGRRRGRCGKNPENELAAPQGFEPR